MSIFSGHPEKYALLQDHIGELVFDRSLEINTDEGRIEKLKEGTLWVSMS